MENDFEIEILDSSPEEATGAQLPVNFLTFGELESDDVKVYIRQDVYKALEKLSVSDTSKELGSILLGSYCQELGKTHVVISGYIEAKYTDASASTLTFTHETWDYIHKEHARRYPDQKIIGWQHTHPNYGIFLSNYDMFIQENFFNMPFQVAYVIDPIQNLRGFFQWKNGKVEKLKGYYIYDEVGKPVKVEQIRVEKPQSSPVKAPAWPKVLMVLLCIVTVLLGFYTLSLSSRFEKQLQLQTQLQSQLAEQSAVIASQSSAIAGLEDQLGSTPPELQSTLVDIWETLTRHEAELDQLQEPEEHQEEENTVTFIAYTVVSGDTLTKICKEHGLDYNANIKIIMAINGIKNPSRIYTGQRILLPLVEE